MTAWQVSREINEIVDLGAIDAALGYIGSEVRTARTGLVVAEERYSEAKGNKLALGWVPHADTDFGKVKGWALSHAIQTTRAARLGAS